MVKIGVVFPSRFDDPGDYLADARALETAGVDAVWIPAAASGDLLLAAIAAVTTRIRLGLLMVMSDAAAGFDERLETLNRLSRSRVLVGIDTGDVVQVGHFPPPLAGHFPPPLAGEGRVGASRHFPPPLAGEGRVGASPSPLAGHFPPPLAGEGRVGALSEHWARVAVPRDRAEWQQTLAGAAASGVAGVLVDQDPRLLDILRSPVEEDDRSDLLLSQG